MVFKLVRTDTQAPLKILLPVGTHLIGRGQFLDCDDKRVSRKHGELQVTKDTISIKSLHQNPCFYIKKGTEETQVLKQGGMIVLYNGDKFGLLPDLFWYELMHCALLDSPVLGNTEPMEETISATEPYNNKIDRNGLGSTIDDVDLPNVDIHEAITQRCVSPASTLVKSEVDSPIKNVGSPSLTPNDVESPSIAPSNVGSPSIAPDNIELQSIAPDNVGSPSIIPNSVESPSQSVALSDLGKDSPSLLAPVKLEPTESLASENNQSPIKRCHSQTSTEEAKRIKTESNDVKQEPDPQPGPSGDQGAAAGSGDNSANPGMPPSPVKPPGRERCMYGAKCYRKNPSHKAQFAHPNDPDWGSGEQGVCPYGRTCMRRDPRHWRDHTHPHGTQPPPANGGNNRPVRQNKPMQKQKKRRQSTQDSDEDSLPADMIVTGKRARKTIQRVSWSGSEDDENEEDPYQTDDDEDEWVPGTQSQFTQDTQDD